MSLSNWMTEEMTGSAVYVPGTDIDTDQIIPGRFVYRPRDEGKFGNHLFYDQRFTLDGNIIEEHPLNDPTFAGATILIADENFACGSARTQAVWAVQDYGVKVVIAPSFGAVFKSNAVRLGLAPLAVTQEDVCELRSIVQSVPEEIITVDFRSRRISTGVGWSTGFVLSDLNLRRLLTGVDDLTITEAYKADLEAFETQYIDRMPWLFG